MYNDARKCSDFAQEFRNVKLHLLPCAVLRPVRLGGAMLQDGEACPSVVRNALRFQRVSSEQLAFTLAHQDWLRTLALPMPRQKLLERHEGHIKLWLVDFYRKVFTVDEDICEQSERQLASEFRLKLEAVLERNQTAGREACFRELQHNMLQL